MKFHISCTTALLGVALAFGAHAGEAKTSQQERMKNCNAEAGTKNLKGDARKSFMSACLKGEAASQSATAATPQQQRMKDCNAQAGAKSLKGEERKAFMSKCLKG